MEKDLDSLTVALRAIASEDASRVAGTLDARLLAALRSRHSASAASTQHSAHGTRHLRQPWSIAAGLGIAATLVAGLSGALWSVRSGPPPTAPSAGAFPSASPRGEIATAFLPLTYSALPYTDAQIVRMEVPRTALKNFGLAPADLPADTSAVSPNIVLADVLVGEDGLARAVRFVRAERAPGVAP